MVQSTTVYDGGLRCRLIHEPSQSQFETDAPKDNYGLGARFSPTDLVGAALGSCILTTIALFLEKDGVNINTAQALVTKEMSSNPRRILKLTVQITMPKGVQHEFRAEIGQIAHTCPVHRSLHPDIATSIEFIYPD